jgi:transposase-like protein
MENISVTPVGVAKAAADKSRVRISTTPEERAEWVRLFEESGKTATEFCKELGLAETTFAVWRKQVRGPAPASPENLTFTEVPQPMVEAALAANATAPAGAVTIHLANGTRLEVAAGTDTAWLIQLATALRA